MNHALHRTRGIHRSNGTQGSPALGASPNSTALAALPHGGFCFTRVNTLHALNRPCVREFLSHCSRHCKRESQHHV